MSILNRGHARHGVIVPKFPAVSGRYYGFRTAYPGVAGTGTMGANTHYAAPFYVSSAFVADQIALSIATGATAGKLIRLGVYSALATTGLPDALLVDSGALAADAIAVVTATISLAFVPGTRYWLTALTDGAPIAQNTTGSLGVLGHDPTIAASLQQSAVYQSVAYAALPATFGAITGYSNVPPSVLVRAT